jgi:hypothetical protein
MQQQQQVYVHVTLMHLDSFAIFGAHMILLHIARCFELNWSLTHGQGPKAVGGLLHAHASLIVLASRAAVSQPHVSYSFPPMIAPLNVCLLI